MQSILSVENEIKAFKGYLLYKVKKTEEKCFTKKWHFQLKLTGDFIVKVKIKK